MKILISKILRKLCLVIINTFFSSTNFFSLKRFLLRIAGIKVGENSKIVGKIKIGTVANLSIGKECWIGSGLSIYGNGNVYIEDKCDLAPDIAFITGTHRVGTKERRAGKGISQNIRIEESCWIGARVTIMGGVTVFKSSIIGTCSLVTKDIKSDVIAFGIPAKEIKQLQ